MPGCRPLRPVLIAGPTASGKSALALAIAERDHGWVINADASQVYHCWRVLTARPEDADLARAPHRLYGHVPCDQRHSTGDWLRSVGDVIAEARAAGARPVIVGGTGLYFTALTEGLAEIPPIPAAVRARSQVLLRDGHVAALLRDLERDDPATHALIDRDNPMRVQRAWEVLAATGRGLAAWHGETPAPVVRDAVKLVVDPEITSLNNNITSRFRIMLKHGAIEECVRFLHLGLDPALPAGRVIGAAQLFAYLRNETTLDEAAAAAITATRQYAKRQRTWLRNRMADWRRLDPGTGLDAVPPA